MSDKTPDEAQALLPVTQAISLKDRRERLGLTLRDVEEISKGSISNSYLSQLETGKIKNPSLENARLLANIYHCQTDDIAEALSLPILTALLRDRIHAALTPSAISEPTKRMEKILGAKFQATPSALSGDTRGKCKADLTALEQAFRAGYAACLDHADPPGPIFYKGTPNEAWAEFLSNEMRALG